MERFFLKDKIGRQRQVIRCGLGSGSFYDFNVDGAKMSGDKDMIDAEQRTFGMKSWLGYTTTRSLYFLLNVG